MTGADLANLVNEAALAAAREGNDRVAQRHFANALEKVQLGAARDVVIPEDERRRTAFHEAGHALVGMLQPGADPVRKVSIIPRGRALGVTLSTPRVLGMWLQREEGASADQTSRTLAGGGQAPLPASPRTLPGAG